MKIGFDAKRLYNNFTGLGNYSRTLLSNFQAYFPEDEYYLYTPAIRPDKITDRFRNDPAYITRMPTHGIKSYWRTCSVKKDLKQDRIEIYHGLSHEIPLGIRRSGIRSVVTIHDLIYRTYPEMFSAIDRKIYDLKFKYACRHADKIIAISESTKNDIIRLFGTPEEKIEVIYQAIQPTFNEMQDSASVIEKINTFRLPTDYLLYVGAVNSRKNLLGILQALTLLPQDLRIPLVIVGNGGTYKKEVLKYAEENHLSQLLIWAHNLTDPALLQAFYQRARIFIYPSHYEGFGLPVTEALLSKTPVITSHFSSLPEAGGPSSYYVDPTKTEEICEGIRRILTDSNLSRKMAEEGYKFAHRQFDPEKLTRQVHELYKSLL